jgi:hypothetical protein
VFRIPNGSKRTSIIGRTGSGKTVFGTWLLAQSDIDKRPWLIIDYKGEIIFEDLERRAITELKVGDKVPKQPGLYITYPKPEVDDEAIDEMLWHVWERGKTGIYVDEGHNLPRSSAFNTCLSQGRALSIPMIVGTQRPVDTSRYVFTQADYFAIFAVSTRDDQLKVENHINAPKLLTEPPPRFHCYWHDVAEGKTCRLTPVPPPNIVADQLNAKAPQRVWW